MSPGRRVLWLWLTDLFPHVQLADSGTSLAKLDPGVSEKVKICVLKQEFETQIEVQLRHNLRRRLFGLVRI